MSTDEVDGGEAAFIDAWLRDCHVDAHVTMYCSQVTCDAIRCALWPQLTMVMARMLRVGRT